MSVVPFVPADPDAALAIEKNGEDSAAPESMIGAEVYPPISLQAKEFAAAANPDGTIGQAHDLIDGVHDQAAVSIVEISGAVKSQVRDFGVAQRNPETAIEIGGQRRDIEGGEFRLVRAERIPREVEPVKSIKTQGGSYPQIAVFGLS